MKRISKITKEKIIDITESWDKVKKAVLSSFGIGQKNSPFKDEMKIKQMKIKIIPKEVSKSFLYISQIFLSKQPPWVNI